MNINDLENKRKKTIKKDQNKFGLQHRSACP